MRKRILSILLMLCMILGMMPGFITTAYASAIPNGTYEVPGTNDSIHFTVSGNTLTISGKGDIPNRTLETAGNILGTEYVTATYGATITKIVVESGITRLGNFAFAFFNNVTEITIPESVTTIGMYAFWGMGITSLQLPSSLSIIDTLAIIDCPSLTTITFGNDSTDTALTTVRYRFVSNCPGLKLIRFSPSTASILPGALSDVANNSGLSVEAYMKYRGAVGYNTDGLNGLPDGVLKNYYELAVQNNGATVNVSPTKNISALYAGYYAAGDTVSFTVTPDLGYTLTPVSSYRQGVLSPSSGTTYALTMASCEDCVMATAIDPSASGTVAASGTMSNNSNITWRVIQVTDGYKLCFSGSGELSVGDDPPWKTTYKDSIVSVEIGEGITKISTASIVGGGAFYNYAGLKEVSFPSSLTEIGDKAFNLTTALESVTLSSGVKTVGSMAFNNCNAIKKVTLNEGLTSIESAAFPYAFSDGSISSATVIIPSTVTSIGANSFLNNGKLTFYNCSSASLGLNMPKVYFCVPVTTTVTGGGVTLSAPTSGYKNYYYYGSNEGSNAETVNITAPSGKVITSIKRDGTELLAEGSEVSSYTYIVANGANALDITLKSMPHTITYSAMTGGTISGVVTARAGDIVTVTATPESGFSCTGIYLKIGSNTVDIEVSGNSFEMPDNDVTISATFRNISIAPAVSSSIGNYSSNTKTACFTLATSYTDTPAFKVYTSETGDTSANGVTASLEAGNMYLNFSSTPAEGEVYYVSATESGKAESVRIKMQVHILSADATLSALNYSVAGSNGGDLSADELTAAAMTDGTKIILPEGTSEEAAITLAGTLNDSKASITTNAGVTLSNGKGTATVTVTAEDGTTKNYVISFEVYVPVYVASVTTSDNMATKYTDFATALSAAQSVSGSTVKLLTDVTTEETVEVNSGTFAIDLNGKTWVSTVTGMDKHALWLMSDSNVTLKDSGTSGLFTSSASYSSSTVFSQFASVTIESGTYECTGNNGYAFYAYAVNENGKKITITGGTFQSRVCFSRCTDVAISGGVFSEVITYIENSYISTVGGLLASGYGYRSTDSSSAWVSDVSGYSIKNVTVQPLPVSITAQPKAAAVTYGYSANEAPTLTVTAATVPADSGKDITYKWYKDGTSIDGATSASYSVSTGLATGDHNYYCAIICDGYTLNSAVVIVTVNKQTGSVMNKDYVTAYTYTGSAIVSPEATNFTTNSGGSFTFTWYSGESIDNELTGTPTNAGTYTLKADIADTTNVTAASATFKVIIAPTTPTITWSEADKMQSVTYTGNAANITAPAVTLVNGKMFDGKITYSYKKSGSNEDYTSGLPTNAGTYLVKAHLAAKGNYTAADSTNELTLTINKANATLTITGIGIGSGKTYDGTPIANPTATQISSSLTDPTVTYTYYGDNNGIMGDTLSGAPTNASVYWVKGVIGERDNTTEASNTFRFTIEKAPLTIVNGTVESRKWDGNTTAPVTGITFEGLKNNETLAFGTDYIVNDPAYADDSVGTGKSVTAGTVELENTAKSNNYTLADGNLSGKGLNGEITKADGPTAPNFSAWDDTTNTFTFESANGTVYKYRINDGDWGEVTASGPTITINVGNVAIPAGKLEVCIKETDTHKMSEFLTNTSEQVFTASLEGSVSLSKTSSVTYGDTLTATVSGQQADAKLHYEWKVGGTNVGTDSNTYIVQGSAIDKTVTVIVTADSYNGSLIPAIVTNEVAKKAVTAVLDGTITKEYDTTDTANIKLKINDVDKVNTSDEITVTAPYATYDSASAGSDKTIKPGVLTVNGTAADWYDVSAPANVTGVITQKTVTVTISCTGKIYDGSTDTTVTYVVNGIFGNDDVTASGTAAYDSANAGNRTVTATGVTLGGAAKDEYKLQDNMTNPTCTATIGLAMPKVIWDESSKTQSVTYTGAAANITAPAVTLVNGEKFDGTITYSYKAQGSETYTDVLPTNAGIYLVKAHLAAKGNYAATDSTNELILTINKATATLTITGIATGSGKTYDGTPIANPTATQISSSLTDPAVTYTYYTDNNGTMGAALSGAPTNAGAYWVKGVIGEMDNTAEASNTFRFTIEKAPLTIVNGTVEGRKWDGNTTVPVTKITFDGLQNNETLAFGTDYIVNSAAYADASVGTDKSVTAGTVELMNTAKSNNYTLADGSLSGKGLTGEITKADGPAAPTFSAWDDAANTFTFESANSMVYKYRINDGDWKEITAKSTTTTINVGNVAIPTGKLEVCVKETDTHNIGVLLINTAEQTFTASLEGSVSLSKTSGVTYGDTLTATVSGQQDNAQLHYQWKIGDTNAGTDSSTYIVQGLAVGKTVTVIVTADSYKGSLTPATVTNEVAKKTVTAVLDGTITKEYDTTDTANIKLKINDTDKVNTSDEITITAPYAAYDSASVGSDKTIKPGALTVNGAAADWYEVSAPANVTGIITQKTVNVTISCTGKIYDGSTDATVTYVVNGIFGSDDVTASGTAVYDSADAGNRTVTATGVTLGGAAKDEYKLLDNLTTCTATIGLAMPKVVWGESSKTQSVKYGNAVEITAPTVTLVNNETFDGTFTYSYKESGSTGAYISGLPTNAGTYLVKAHLAANSNYAAADSTNELTLTIEEPPEKTDAEKVAADKAVLEIGFAQGDSVDAVTQNLSLTVTGAVYGSKITWLSGNPAVISNSGGVIRPSYASGDADVTVTASVYSNGVSDTKVFSLKVLKLAQTTHAVTFKDWDGKVLKTQTVNEGSEATAPGNPSRKGYTFIGWDKDFSSVSSDLTVVAQYNIVNPAATDAEKVAADKAVLTIGFAQGDSADAVTQNLSLTVTGAVYGSQITWISSNPAVISVSGVVIRPSYTSGDADVTVTASVYSNGVSDTKVFSVKVLKLAQPTDTVTFKDWDGTVLKTETVNEGSGATAPSNPSRDGYTFTGWDTVFSNVTSNLTVTAQYKKNTSGGDGGSSSGGGSGNSTPDTEKTYQAAVSENGAAATDVPVNVNKDTGSAVIYVGSDQGGIVKGGGTVAITMPSIPDIADYAINIPVPYLSTANASGTFTFMSDAGNIIVPSNMLTGTDGEKGQKAQISINKGDKSVLSDEVKAVIGDRPIIQLAVAIDGNKTAWNNPNAPVTVSIPYKPAQYELENPESIVVWYIDGSGKAVSVANGHYDTATGSVIFTTTHFSDYAVGYNKVSFSDVSSEAWYGRAVSYIAARGITTGAGNGCYNPEASITRGEFLVMLLRAYGINPDTDSSDNFSDAGNIYYTGYLAAAKRLGISKGIGNNTFAPDMEITRQEMFTLLYNALKAINQLPNGNTGKRLTNYNDAEQVASWAREALALFSEAGTINGDGDKLLPTETTTRAEMAQVLYNLVKK